MNKLQKDAIAHYNRMIKWAKTQPQDIPPHPIAMKFDIGEMWGREDCSYCKACHVKCWNNCPLFSGKGDPSDIAMDGNRECCNGLWGKMNFATTWSEWIYYAQRIKQYIKDNG